MKEIQMSQTPSLIVRRKKEKESKQRWDFYFVGALLFLLNPSLYFQLFLRKTLDLFICFWKSEQGKVLKLDGKVRVLGF